MSLRPDILKQLEALNDGQPSSEIRQNTTLSALSQSFYLLYSPSEQSEGEYTKNLIADKHSNEMLALYTPEETLIEHLKLHQLNECDMETHFFPLDGSNEEYEFCKTFDNNQDYPVDEDFLSNLPFGVRSGCMIPNISGTLGNRNDKHEFKALEKFAISEIEFGVFENQLCEYVPPCWRRLDSHTCTIRLKELFCKHKLDQHLGSADYKELYRSILTNPALQRGPIPNTPTHCINLLDCSLNLENFTFYEHTADDAFFNYLNVTRSELLNPGDGSVFESFINSASNGDPNVRQQILELTALACTGYQIKAFFVIVGPSGSGKSEYCRFLVELLGHRQIGSIGGIHQLGSRFAMANMEDKQLAVCMDLPNVPLPPAAIGTLKVATGNDAKNSEAKYQDGKTIFRSPLWLFASNFPLQIPHIEAEEAFLKRMITIPFLNAVPPEKQIQNLYQKLLKESPYILRESIRAYQDLIQRNFILTRSDIPLEYSPGESRESIVTVQDFFNKHCIFDSDSTITTERLYQAFISNTKLSPAEHISKISFGKIFAELMSYQKNVKEVKRAENSERRGYRGIRLAVQDDF